MSIDVLQALILCICTNIKGTQGDKEDCMVKYVNCSIVGPGDIIPLKEFKNKCTFTVGQERCYRGN